MIKRIKEIKNIGVFKNCTTPIEEFTKITFIYGNNTYGKSTLTDIFDSIATEKADIVLNRKTIPNCGDPHFVINADDLSCNSQKAIVFTNGYFANNILKKKVIAFNSDFINDNIFAGSEVVGDRSTKENFTDFILGETGATLAKELEANKIRLNELKKELDNAVPTSQVGMPDKDIIAFIKLQTSKSKDELEKEIKNHTEKQIALATQISNSNAILNIESLRNINTDKLDYYYAIIDNMKAYLSKYFTITVDVIQKLNEYLQKTFKQSGANRANLWIQFGYENSESNDVCPYCAQEIPEGNVVKTIFAKYYDKAYLDFCKEIKDTKTDNLNSLVDNFLSTTISTYISEISIKSKFFAAIDLDENLTKLLEKNNDIKIKEIALIEALQDLKLQELITKKQSEPHISLNVEFETLKSILTSYIKIIQEEINPLLLIIYNIIEVAKNRLKSSTINQEKKIIDSNLESCRLLLNRLNEDALCKKYVEIFKRRKQLKETNDANTIKLEEDQNEYLTKYFSMINELFKQFGSKNFSISKTKIDNKGNKKVYGININFKGQAITNKTKKVFSESDRRALAFSIFLAKILCMATDEKKQIIIVLDDPITSFDDNRIIATISKIKEFKADIEQVIILTHHEVFIKKFSERYNESDISFFEIENNIETSCINKFDTNRLNSEFLCEFHKIYNFCKCMSNEYTENRIRIFMETFLNNTFSNQLIKCDSIKLQLRDKINKLVEIDALNDTQAKQLHIFRENLNPDCHTQSTNSIEAVRLQAIEIVEFLYTKLRQEG